MRSSKSAHSFSGTKSVSGPLSETFKHMIHQEEEQGSLNEKQLVERICISQGKFVGLVEWCSNLGLNDWKTHNLQITEKGELIHALDEEDVRDLQNTMEEFQDSIGASSTNHPVVKHLQSCELQLLHDSSQHPIPVIRVKAHSNTIYLKVTSKKVFFNLFSSLVFWKSLKSNNVFSKTIVIQPIFHKPENPTNIILCQCHVFGPMPKNNKNSSGFNSWAEPPNSDPEECGWFAAMGVLKSDGILDFLLQSDGSLIYSIDITKFLCSEIQIVDASIFQSDKFLFLGILPELREQMQVSSNENCFVDNTRAFSRSRRLTPQQLYLRFPLRIDLEDWFVALNSFAMPDVLSLLGTDKSNELRISNRFKISILEANLDDLKIDDPCLYAEVNIWDHVMARTSIVQNSKSPFWREEFDFNYSVKTKILHINIRNCSHANAPSKNDKIVGKIQITQEMINDSNLNKETRLPVFAHSNKNFQIGTICIKVISSLNFVLQPNNFAKFEQVLTNVALPKISNYMCDSNFAKNLKLEDISLVFLDIFQAINREDDWFQALIDREFVNIDKTIMKNSNQNHSSNHIYNSLFRGNSILTKTMETYCYRVGQEYLDKCIGKLIRELIEKNKSYEIDPSRIKESDPTKKQAIIETNFKELYQLAKKTWSLILSTSNDLPSGIKTQLKCFRKKLEIIDPDESSSINSLLNCMSGFLFLRFFCPVILNPKIFNFVENHPNENCRRTLTLLAKILMNLSTLTPFGPKEPWMTTMNTFIDDHRLELLDYLDRVTEKKLDFTPKKLKLSSSLTRPKLDLNPEILKQLPANPYLIDKCLRETELVNVLATSKENEDSSTIRSVSMEHMYKAVQADSGEDNEFSIGGLEFEKISENNTEVFGNDLLKLLQDEEESEQYRKGTDQGKSAVNSDDLMQQLEQESTLLFHKIKQLVKVLDDYEYPSEVILGKSEYASFIANSLYYDKDKNLYLDFQNLYAKKNGFMKLFTSKTSAESFFNLSEKTEVSILNGPVEEITTRATRLSMFGRNSNENKPISESKIARWFRKA